jgi:hypothetical protein
MASHFPIAKQPLELVANKLGLLGHRPVPTDKVKDVFAKIETDGATAVFI